MNMDRQFQIDNVKFELSRIPPMKGWDICEMFREAIASSGMLGQEAKADTKDKNAMKKELIKALLSIPRSEVAKLRDALFEFVTFKTPEQPKPMTLQGLEDMAFQTLDPFSIYEVIGRCFIVNFTKSFIQLLARHGITLKDEELNPPDTSSSEPGASHSS